MAEIFVFLKSDRVVFYGSEIMAAREAAGLSQQGLAARLMAAGAERVGGKAVSQVAICRIENQDVGFMTGAEARAFCRVLGIQGD